MSNIIFGFDLHNTLIDSNSAWERAYSEMVSERVEIDIRKMIYNKTSRRKISEILGLDHSTVVDKYTSIEKKKTKLFDLLVFYYQIDIKPFLISSAKREIVYADIKHDIINYIERDRILTRDNFCKSNIDCWNSLIKNYSATKMVYYGNDIDEDYIESDNIICVTNSQFLFEKSLYL